MQHFPVTHCLFLCFQICLVCLVCLCVDLHYESTVQRQKIHWAIHCQTEIEQRQKQTPQEHISGHERNPSFQPLPPQWSPQPPLFPTSPTPRPDDFSLFCNLNSVQKDFGEWLKLKVRANDSWMLYFESKES